LTNDQTLQSITVLALVLQSQGKYDEAEQLNRRALEGREKELGIHHPDTLASVSNLASVLQSQGKYDEAEKLNRRALEGKEKELGVHHPDTLKSVYCLAHLPHATKLYAEAKKLYQRAYDGRVQTLGPQHPLTIACGNNLSTLKQEAKQVTVANNQDPASYVHYEGAIISTTRAESVAPQASSKQKDKEESLLARIKRRIRGKD
jgi:tetratricopeptide (TPR) repeat protein